MAVCPRFLAACVSLSGLFVSAPALAYCRTHTEDPGASSCPEPCSEEGLPLFWAKPNLTYTFNVKGFPDLTDGQLRGIFDASFGTWESVDCDGEPIGLDIRAKSAKTALELGPEADEPNDNVIVHFDAVRWTEQALPPHAFAITAVWFSASDGEILGADMMFNGTMDPYGECSPGGCTASDPNTDLRNVATHEIGHFLGLSHSDVPNSTMWCDADAHETSKRSLSDDDIAGVCDIYPPGTAFLRASSESQSHACSLGSVPGTGTLAWLGAWAVVLGLGQRRRRRS